MNDKYVEFYCIILVLYNKNKQFMMFSKFFLRRKLRNKELSDFEKYKPTFTYGKVIKVYDGDTITMGVYENKKYLKYSIRLAGIDAPELRTPHEIEKKAGYFVRDRLREKIMDRFLEIEVHGLDKYGRVLGDLYLPSSSWGCCGSSRISIKDWLLHHKYVIPYEGGTKEAEMDWSYLVSSSSSSSSGVLTR